MTGTLGDEVRSWSRRRTKKEVTEREGERDTPRGEKHTKAAEDGVLQAYSTGMSGGHTTWLVVRRVQEIVWGLQPSESLEKGQRLVKGTKEESAETKSRAAAASFCPVTQSPVA